MFIDIDYDKRKKGYKINLAKPNQQTIASVSEAYGANYSIKLGNINEVTFNVPYFIDKLDERVKNENIELIKEKMYTKISYNNNDEWMVIDTIEDVGSGDEKYMTVTAFTNVYETSNRKINELNLQIVNPEEYYDAILNDVAWNIGTIDPLFKDIYRSVELSNVTVLEAIITGAETFGAVLDFDTENKEINLIDMDSRAKYRGLNINYSNFLQSINRKRSVDEMTTRLYVYGSEDVSIENVNPTGMRYLEDFTYFLYPFERDENKNVIKSSHYMSDELAHAILDKNELSEEYQPLIQAMQEEIDEETIEYINETTLLNELRFDEMSVSGLLDIAKATGDNNLILQRQGELAEVKTKISIKELTVDHINATIEDLERQISQLQSQISVTSFSKELYDELSMYIIESEFRDDRYIDEEELYRDALKKFDESKSPSVVIEASIDNIIDSLEEDYYSDKVVLGDIARVTDKEMSVEMKSLIVELSFDLDNNTCDVTIANGDIEKDGYDRILSVLYDTQSTTTMLENNKYKWDTVTDVKTEVDLMRDGEIDATRNRIKAGFRESVTIEDRGIILSNPDFPNEIVIMQAGVIALSTDGGENWSTSITPRGVMADTIIGKLVASNNLIVTNDSGSFRIDGDGLTVDMDSIKIMSGEGDTPENIVDSWNKMLITMDEFADDGKLNEYEKNQIARQWNSIAMSHSSMVDAIQNAYGPETPENPYPTEYEIYMESYEELRGYLNDEIQSDGHTILDPLYRGETTDIDSNKYNRLVSDYEVNKDRFQTVIPLEFSQTFMEQTRNEISLNYVKNGEVATKLNLSEEGVRIDGRLLEVNSETHFNDDLVMNAGLIRSGDGAINIDLNAGVINLSRPLKINAVPVATEEFVEESLADAIKNIDVEYGITSDKNTAPTDWSTAPPAWQDGKYIWSRTLTVYKNGNTEITDPVNITGATGSSGGIGQAGRSVKSIQEQYYLSTSPLDLENGSWIDNPPEWEADKYIWTRSVITYENPSGVDRTDPVSVSGQQGPKGDTGLDGKDAPIVKLSGKTQIIKVNENGRLTPSTNFTVTGSSVNTVITTWRYSVDGGDFVTAPPIGVTRSGVTIIVNPSLVEFDTLTIRVSDGRVSDDFTIAKAVDGATGKDGEDAYTVILTNESHTFAGNIFSAVSSSTTTDIVAYKGDVRVPVTVDSVTGHPEGMEYQISSNGTINTRVTFSVDENLIEESGAIKLNLVLGGQYITKEFSFAVAYKGERGEKGERGATGSRGPQGDEGVGISSVTEHYLISNQSTGVTYNTSGWRTSIPTMTPELRFLWNYEEIHFTDGTSEPTLPVVVGVYGQQGPKGSEGEDGRSIEKIEERYLATSSGSGVTRSTDGWKEEMQVTTPTKKYLWNYEIITWSKAPLKTYVEPIIIGIHGDKGETGERGPRGLEGQQGPEGKQGIQGPVGKDGISTYTHIAYATSKTGADFEHSTFDNATYIGMYVSNESDSSDSPSDYEWTLIKGKDGSQGLRGPEGKDGRTPYFHTAWANNSTGTSGFSTTVSTNKLYIGTATTFEEDDPEEPSAYSWTKIKGDKGDKGDEGTGVSDVSVKYQNHSNGTTAPTGNWSNSPNPVKGTYLWARTITSYTDGEEITTYNVSYNATDGQRGPEGPQGGTGTDGTGVSGTEVRYTQSTSGTTAPTSGWQENPAPPVQGQYNWTRTIVNYTDGTKSTSYSTSYNAKDGVKGDKGDEGKGILSTDVTYKNHTNGTTAPTGTWNTTIPTPVKGEYLWTRTVTKYTEGDPITTYSVSYYAKDGQKGDTGSTGNTGPKGDEGTGVNGTEIRYSQSSSGTSAPSSPWLENPPTQIQGQYNWTRTVITYTDSSSSTSYSTSYNAKDGIKGDKGDKGDEGTGVKGAVVTYRNHTSGTATPPSTGWVATPPTPNKGQYMWTRTITTYTDNSDITTYSVAYNALDGQKGDDGKGITSTAVTYAQTTSGTSTPTSWNTTRPSPNQGEYMWTRTIINYTDGTNSTAYNTSYSATNGQKGDKGDKGDAGKGIQSTEVTYQNHTNGTTAPTGTWSKTVPSPVKGQYLWTRTVTQYTEGSPITTYSVSYYALDGQRGETGNTGPKGDDGTGVNTTTVRYFQSTSGTTTPTGSGATTPPTPIQGQYNWTKTVITYTDNTSSTAWSTSYNAKDGLKGDKGDAGKGIKSQVVTYQNHSNGTTAPTGSWTDSPSPVKGEYLWTRTVTQYTEGNPITTYAVAYNALDGQRGATGGKGDEGTGIGSTVIRYFQSTSGTTPPTGNGATAPPAPIQGQYNWTRTEITYTDGTKSTAWSTSYNAKDGKKGDTGATGSTGPKGDAGKGITDQTVAYQNHTNGTTAPTGSWVSSPSPVKGRYLWTRTVTTYTEGNPVTTYAVAYNATDGQRGPEGTGISTTTVTYAQTTSGTATPTSWVSTRPAPNKGQYLWTRTIINYTDGTSSTAYSTSYSALDGQKGDKGDTGSTGPKGDAGKGINSQTITYQNHSNGTTAPTGSWSDNPSPVKGQYLWTRTVTTYTTGNPITTYSVAYNAKDGQTGNRGPEGTGISSSEIRYQQSTSGSSVPSGTWQVAIPAPVEGRYLWTRTTIKYTDGTDSVAYSTSYYATKGEKGDRGATGATGPKGAEGTGVKSAVIAYAIHTNGTTAPTSGWQATVPTPVKGRYMWTRTTTTYTDNTDSVTYSVAYQATDGLKGDKGSEGTGVSSSAVTYAQSASGTTTPTSWSGTRPSPVKGQYLWTRTIINYTDGTNSIAYSTSYYATDGQKGDKGDTGDRGPQGPQGATGSRGPIGNTGTSVTSITEYYLATSASSGIVASDTRFTTAIQTMTASNKYLWNYEKVNFSDNTSQPTIPVIIGVYGDKGQTGSTGATGRSITSITEHYLVTSASSGVTRSTSGWSTTVKPTTETNKYLWNYETINWSSGTTPTYVDPIIIGVHGAKGPQGAQGPQGTQGPKGDNGQSQYTHIRYSANSNGSSMTTSPVTATKYIGIAVTNSATAPAYGSFTWSKYVGDNGSQGPQGPQGTQGVRGPAGANGQPTYTWVKYAEDKNGGGMSDYPEGKRFIGLAFNKTTATESTTASHYQWSEMPQNIEIGGRNLLVQHTITEGGYLTSTGAVTASATWFYTDYIPVSGYTKLITSGYTNLGSAPSVAYYDANKVFVKGINNAGASKAKEITIDTGIAYIRFSGIIADLPTLKIEKGNIATDWTEAPEDTQVKLDEKADTDLIDNIQGQLEGLVSSEDYDNEMDVITNTLTKYQELIDAGGVATTEAVNDITKLLDRTEAVENNLGQFTESWNFEVTEITMGEEGLFLGDNITDMGIRIAPQVGDTPPRIDFVDNGTVVAEITGQYMRINRGIFVQSAQIGEHQIETIAGGHTIWSWIPS